SARRRRPACSLFPYTALCRSERFLSRSQDDRGRWVNVYADPEPVRGSFQPLDESDVKERGFDISRSYAALYTSHDMQNVQRGEENRKSTRLNSSHVSISYAVF